MTVLKTVQNVTGPTLTIDLPPEFRDRQVEVEVRLLEKKESWGEGLRRSAGALADDPEWDVIMEQIHRERKLDRRPLPEDE
jgi:hypothetical protein